MHRFRYFIISLCSVCLSAYAVAANAAESAVAANATESAEQLEEHEIANAAESAAAAPSLTYFINYISDDMVWEGETTGNWTQAERMLFSIRGNSYLWNRFYKDGFRVDSRFLSGSMLYVPDMNVAQVEVDAQRGILYIDEVSLRQGSQDGDGFRFANYLSLEGNVGNLGGISPLTKQMINVLHSTAQERAVKPFEHRNHILGAGELTAVYGFHRSGSDTPLYQRVYAHAGSRRVVTFDEGGENGFYDAPYGLVQMDGQLPCARDSQWTLHYILNMQHRSDLYSELGYGAEEVADYTGVSASLYTRLRQSAREFTTGLTYQVHRTLHANPNFQRNLVDQDGEGFDPWNADGQVHEISWAATYSQTLASTEKMRLRLLADAYNSLLFFRPSTERWSNQTYVLFPDQDRSDWYRYDFRSSSFSSAILENKLSMDVRYDAQRWFSLLCNAGVTLDGMLLRSHSVGMPQVEAELQLLFHPVRWFSGELVFGHYRTRYTWDQLRLLSLDYQNGELIGENAPYPYYGGAYLDLRKCLQSPQYAVVDLPFRFVVRDKRGGEHIFSCLSTARLYYHLWQIVVNPDYGLLPEAKPYLLTYQTPLREAGLFALPLYLSNTLKYEYHGQKVFFGLSWQSYQMSGTSTLGNGAENNSIGSLSYSMLNPTTYENLKDAESAVKSLHRLDQDKAYICRVQLGAAISSNWDLQANFHWQDGTPISNYRIEAGNIWPCNTKGINPSDMHFGMRKDMFFNLDIRLSYQGNINMRNQHPQVEGSVPFCIALTGYNLWDFGTEWYEYSFDQYMEHGRRAMSICIPRGLLVRFQIGLTKAE